MLQGSDAGVSFQSAHDREGAGGYTVIANTSDGAWPLAEALSQAWRSGEADRLDTRLYSIHFCIRKYGVGHEVVR